MPASDENGKLSGKVALVTGAASGISRTTALAFTRRGANVVVADINRKGSQDAAGMIEDLGGQALAVRCDVTRGGTCKRRSAGQSRSSAGSTLPSTARVPSRSLA